MRALAWAVIIAATAAIISGCGGSSSAPSSTTVEAHAASPARDGFAQRCERPRSVVRDVLRFEVALRQGNSDALQNILSGRFQWLSISGWPGQRDNFVAYSPRRAIAFVQREGGLAFQLESVAISPADDSPYVNVAYQGVVKEADRSDRGSAGIIVGKAAFNCNGTLRVWSMALPRRGSPAEFAVCGRAADPVRGLKVCRQS